MKVLVGYRFRAHIDFETVDEVSSEIKDISDTEITEETVHKLENLIQEEGPTKVCSVTILSITVLK